MLPKPHVRAACTKLLLSSCAAISTSTALHAQPHPPGRHIMKCVMHLQSIEDESTPKLGTWPQYEQVSRGARKPGQVIAPEPSQEVKEAKPEIVKDASQATVIEEYDRAHGGVYDRPSLPNIL